MVLPTVTRCYKTNYGYVGITDTMYVPLKYNTVSGGCKTCCRGWWWSCFERAGASSTGGEAGLGESVVMNGASTRIGRVLAQGLQVDPAVLTCHNILSRFVVL